jgi:Zn-dependent metalloprotease
VYKNIINYFKSIQKKPEETRIKIMWISVAFFMIVVVGIWWMDFASNKSKNIKFNQSNLSSLSDLQNDVIGSINEIGRQKGEFPEQIKIGVQSELETIVKNYIKENNIIEKENLSDLKLKNIEKSEDNWRVSYDQYYNGVLVNGSNIYFVVDAGEKIVVSYNSNFDSDIKISIEPKITYTDAYNLITENYNLSSADTSLKSSQLVVYRDVGENGIKYYLAWKMNLWSEDSAKSYYYFVDAHSGKIIKHAI